MTKRILIGNDGSGNFRIRASAAGYNVETAPLDQILFDASSVPGRIITQGTAYCEWNNLQTSQPNVPYVTTFAHGVPAGLSFMIIAVGKALFGDGSDPQDWLMWQYVLVTPGSTQRVVVRATIGNPTMQFRYCSPFRFSGDLGNGFTYWGGWWISWDGTTITVNNNLGHGVSMRWMALEV